MITIVDVMRDEGYEPLPEVTWPLGNMAREYYEQQCGELPLKQLRTKTYGHGSHCFAVYPEWMREPITRMIRQFKTESARQMELF
jgi:hypothetical protein